MVKSIVASVVHTLRQTFIVLLHNDDQIQSSKGTCVSMFVHLSSFAVYDAKNGTTLMKVDRLK